MPLVSESDLFLHIQPDSPVPIYEQIVAQVTFAIASGALEPGTMIPSVRDLAGRLLVHPNTVARAFQELERRGAVAARRGRGMEVTGDAPVTCQAQRREIVRGRIREALREAASSALTPEEIHRLVEEELARVNGKSGRAAKEKSQAFDVASSEKRSHGLSD
jgi:GntR family transcriptional regulator